MTHPSDTATLYTGPIPITGLTDLRVAAFDPAGNFLYGQRQLLGPRPVALPSSPTGLAADTVLRGTRCR